MKNSTIKSHIEKASQTRWDKSAIALKNYQQYLKDKDNSSLTYIDLLYISNFKGGNASIREEEATVNEKLKKYDSIIKKISKKFKQTELKKLTNSEIITLKDLLRSFLNLSQRIETKIDGFKSSYLSALLHSHFPNLTPILDRRVLINSGIVNRSDQVNKSGQIKEIEKYYKDTLDFFYKKTKEENKSIREIDKQIFTIKLKRINKDQT